MQSYRTIPSGREFRLLPGRDRERSLILDTRPNTTHTVYRVRAIFTHLYLVRSSMFSQHTKLQVLFAVDFCVFLAVASRLSVSYATHFAC